MEPFIRARGLRVTASGLLVLVPFSAAAGPVRPVPGAIRSETRPPALETRARLPLAFVPNHGQAEGSIRLVGQGPSFRFAFRPGEALFAFTRKSEGKTRGTALALQFVDGSPRAVPEGGRPG